jgi:hypothetical protein
MRELAEQVLISGQMGDQEYISNENDNLERISTPASLL